MQGIEGRAKMTDVLASFIKHTEINLPDDILSRLRELRDEEDGGLALEIYDVMFKNLELAQEMCLPICQDTGFMQFLVRCGSDFPLLGELDGILKDALAAATKETPLRLNVVETFSEKNTGTNMGCGAPTIWWEIVPGSACEIYTYPAGGGCSMPGAATVLMPSEGYDGAMEFVIERVRERGPNACPPLLIGVGIANSAETAALNAKHALFRPAGSHNEDAGAAKMESEIELRLNESGIGPQGLGGRNTVYGVNLINTARHPACMAVAVATGCWVHRRGCIRFENDLRYESSTHGDFNLDK